MHEIEGSLLQDGSDSSVLRGFRNCREYHRARFGNGIGHLVRRWSSSVPVRVCEVEPDINQAVVDRANHINEDTLLHDEDVTEFFEENHLSELDRLTENMDKREMITVCCVAIRKYPLAYIQVIAEYIMELTRKGRKR